MAAYSRNNKLAALMIFGGAALAGLVWALWDIYGILAGPPRHPLLWLRPLGVIIGAAAIAIIPAWFASIRYDIDAATISKSSWFGAQSFRRADIRSYLQIGVNDLQLFLANGDKAMTVTIEVVWKDPAWVAFLEALPERTELVSR